MNAGRAAFALATGLLGGLGALGALAPRPSAATHVTTARPNAIVLRPLPTRRSSANTDPTRSGVSPTALPDRPLLLWRRTAPGAFERTLLSVDAHGVISAAPAKAPFLIAWSPAGEELHRVSLGLAPAVTGVIVTNDGTRVVVDAFGVATGFTETGTPRFRTPLELLDRHARVSVAASAEGGVWIAAGSEVMAVDPDGVLSQRMRLTEMVLAAPVATRRGPVIVTRSGAMHLLRNGAVHALGTLGGEVGEGGLATRDGRTVHAVVESRAMVAFDLSTEKAIPQLAVSDASLHGPVAYLADGVIAATTYGGELARVRASGEPMARIALEDRPVKLVTDGGQVNFAALDESPRPITDRDGRLAFARVGGALGVVAADGTVVRASAGCASPCALAGAGERRFAVACRDGEVLVFGEASP